MLYGPLSVRRNILAIPSKTTQSRGGEDTEDDVVGERKEKGLSVPNQYRLPNMHESVPVSKERLTEQTRVHL